jgi:prepilin signal peptidase PulO-like enzyme (type II secretory pathway)
MEVTPGLAFKVFVCATATAGLIDMYVVQALKQFVSQKFKSGGFAARNLRWVRAATPIRFLIGQPALAYMRTRTLFFPGFELTFGGIALLCLFVHGPGMRLVNDLVFLMFALPLAVISWQDDPERSVTPDIITIPGIATGLLLALFDSPAHLVGSVVGALGGAGVLFAVYLAWYWMKGEEGLGLGAIKALALVGAFTGWKAAFVAFFASTVLGSLFGLLLVGRGGTTETRLPFTSFLMLGGILALLWGEAAVSLYSRLK